MKSIELISCKKINDPKYKYAYTFLIDGKRKRTTKFGATGYSDYTIHKDIERRNRYINRHWKDLKTKDPTRAGYLSMYILWNYPSYKKSLDDYKKRLEQFNKTGKFPLEINKFNEPDNIAFFGAYTLLLKQALKSASPIAKEIAKDVAKQAALITAEKVIEKTKRKCNKDEEDCANFGKIPKDVLNPKLYLKIKNDLKSKIKGRRWGVYDSSRLIRQYKDAGGRYKATKKEFGTDRWFKEKWIDACAWANSGVIKPCGRSNSQNQKIRYCRPLNRITKDTPITVKELGKLAVKKACKAKMQNPKKKIYAKDFI